MRTIFFSVLFILCMVSGAKAQGEYGHNAEGKFWLSDSLYQLSHPNMTPQIVTAVTKGELVDMVKEIINDRLYWVYESGEQTFDIEVYSFKTYEKGKDTRYIPDVFTWDKKLKAGSKLIKTEDVVRNEWNGHDFSTPAVSY